VLNDFVRTSLEVTLKKHYITRSRIYLITISCLEESGSTPLLRLRNSKLTMAP
jgi:hypothetical protein